MDLLQSNIFGNTILDYSISLGIVVAAVLASTIASRFLRRYILSWTSKTRTELDDLFVERIFPPLRYLILVVGIAIAKGHLQFPEKFSFWFDKFLVVVGIAVFFVIIIRIVHGLIEIIGKGCVKRLQQRQPADLQSQVRNVERIKKQVREIGNMLISLLGVLTILSNLGVDLKAIWASLGIGGIALVVAVQEPLRNMVGRIYIFSTGIFDEGHFIVFDGWAGTVKRIAMFRTYLELFTDMTTVSIPNSDFIKGVVKNYFGRTKFMYKWDLDVPYDIPPQKIQELVVALKKLISNKPEVNPDMCWIYLERLDSYSKVVRTWFQVNLPNWSESLYYGNRVLHDIQLLFESMDIPFAFPTQTLHLKSEDSPREERTKNPNSVAFPRLDDESAQSN